MTNPLDPDIDPEEAARLAEQERIERGLFAAALQKAIDPSVVMTDASDLGGTWMGAN